MDISQEALNLEQLCDQLILCSSEDREIRSEARCKIEVLSGNIQALFEQGKKVKAKTHADMAEEEWDKKKFFEFLRKLVDRDTRCSLGIKKYFPFVLE